MIQATFSFAVGQLVRFTLGRTEMVGQVTLMAIDDAGEIYCVQWADKDGSEREMWLRLNRLREFENGDR